MCTHDPRCPDAYARDWFAAHNVATHPEQGWSLLCNGVIVFDDLGFILPVGGETNILSLSTRRESTTAARSVLPVAA